MAEKKVSKKLEDARKSQIGSGINKTLMNGAIEKGRALNNAKMAERLRKKK